MNFYHIFSQGTRTPQNKNLPLFQLYGTLYTKKNYQTYFVQGFLSSWILSRNIKLRVYKTTILPVVLHRCETWFLTLREEKKTASI
mgnify:CR=1 FL=1